jgi:hypothetical protein
LDFKRELDTTSTPEWCEIIKDIVAFANSGGGVIVFGVNNDGSNSGSDISAILSFDVANITDKIEAYTGHQFAGLEIAEIYRAGEIRAALIISPAEIPIIFTRPGADVIVSKKQRPAFAKGTIYFRHGAKSEPGNRDDLVEWRDGAVEKVRRSWMGGIRKVIEAPIGHVINVVSSPERGVNHVDGLAITAEINATPGAMRVVPHNAEEIWPYRQKDLLQAVNQSIDKSPPVNGHDILCINSHLNTLKHHPDFAYKPHRLASPQYSEAYAAWIISGFENDERFFQRMREEFKTKVKDKRRS